MQIDLAASTPLAKLEQFHAKLKVSRRHAGPGDTVYLAITIFVQHFPEFADAD